MRYGATDPKRIYGLSVGYERLAPSARYEASYSHDHR